MSDDPDTCDRCGGERDISGFKRGYVHLEDQGPGVHYSSYHLCLPCFEDAIDTVSEFMTSAGGEDE